MLLGTPKAQHERGRSSPALILFFLAPAIAELLSGSSPPVEFFNPLGFLILISLYGSGAIIVRELVVRWKKGWASLLMLGAAYGIVEEGLMAKSIFDPAWPDLALLGSFGRWVGVNWVWALMLTIYHATFSIAIPILIVELIFPSRRRERWIGPRTFSLLLLLISAVAVIGFVWLTPYRPPFVPYAAAVFAVIGIGYAARRIPHQPKPLRTARKPPGTKTLFLFAFLATLCFFMLLHAGPFLIPFPVIVMLTAVVFVSLVGMLLVDLSSRGLDDLQQFSLAAGALGFLIVLAPLQELDKARTDNPVGMGIVGLSFLLLLALLGYRIGRRLKHAHAAHSYMVPGARGGNRVLSHLLGMRDRTRDSICIRPKRFLTLRNGQRSRPSSILLRNRHRACCHVWWLPASICKLHALAGAGVLTLEDHRMLQQVEERNEINTSAGSGR